jgi:hypothetical protein
MKIAVDFDGTIVEHAFPAIGKDLLFAFETLKELQKQGHLIILWTYRSGELLDNAINYCKSKGVEFYAVNKNYPEEIFDDTVSRKIDAEIYIDDRNFGGFPGWVKIWEVLNLESTEVLEDRLLKQNNNFINYWIKKLLKIKI